MKTTLRIAVLGLIVGLACGTQRIDAQDVAADGVVSDGQAGRIVLENTIGSASPTPWGPMIHVDGVFGNGQGWEGNLFRAEAMLPVHLTPGRSLFFFNLNGAVDQDGQGVGLFTGGYRVWSPEYNRVFTIAGVGDVDDGPFNTYTRAGLHLSSLGKHVDVIANITAIAGNDTNVLARGFVGTPFFQGHNILSRRQEIEEVAYGTVDFLIGGPLPIAKRLGTKLYAGGHWHHSAYMDDAIGFDLRGLQQFNDDVDVQIAFSHDNVFKSNTYVQVGMTLPTGKRAPWMRRWMKHRRVRDRMMDRPIRIPRIPTRTRINPLPDVAAINLATGTPANIYYVTEGSRAGGTGTFEDPAPALGTFQALPIPAQNGFHVVYVTANGAAGTLFPTNGMPFNIRPGQRMLSAAITQTIATNFGPITLPGSGSGLFPTVVNPAGGDVIGVNSGSELSGFIVDGGGTGRPIVAIGAVGFNINNNTARNSSTHGIVLSGVSGTIAAGTPGILIGNTSSGNPVDGISLINFAPGVGVLDLYADGNVANNNGPLVSGTGLRIEAHNGNVINADPGVVAGTGLVRNTTNGNGTGTRLNAFSGGVLNARLIQHTATGNTDPASGVSATATGAGSMVNIGGIINSDISNNTGFGFNGTATMGGTLTMNNVFGSAFRGNGLSNMRLTANPGSTVIATIGSPGRAANDFSGAQTGAGIEMLSVRGSMFIGIQNNQIGTAAAPNATAGIVGTFDGGVSNLTVGGPTVGHGNVIGPNNGVGAGVAVAYTNSAGVPFAPQFISGNNLIQGFGGFGMSITNQSPLTNLTAISAADTIAFNGGGGLLVTNNSAAASGQIDLLISGANYSRNGGDAVQVNVNNASTASVSIANNSVFSFNSGNGAVVNANSTSNVNLSVVQSHFLSNLGNGIVAAVNPADGLAAVFNSVIIGRPGLGNNISSNQGNGVLLDHNSTGLFRNVVVEANLISANLGTGVLYDADMTAQIGTPFRGVIRRNFIQFNQGHGVLAEIRRFGGTNAAPILFDVVFNTIQSNALTGVQIFTSSDQVRPTTVGLNAVTFVNPGPGVVAHSPNDPAFAAQLPPGTFKAPPSGRYLSLITDIGVRAFVTDNNILQNGAGGAVFLVGTDTYQAVDFSRNRALLNGVADFRTGSFRSGNANTPTTTNAAGFDTLTLDATAQFDLRFLDNSMNTIDVSTASAAFFTNADAGKNFLAPVPWTTAGDSFSNRPAFFYQVDNAGLLDARNVIINAGVPVSASAAFGAGRYNLNAAAIWQDPGFAQNQPLP